MRDKKEEALHFNNKKTVYGPVKSWRFGQSLGIDPLYQTSICSFNCFYCQLGHIQKITNEIKQYVPTQQVLDDFQELINNQTPIDVITYSGSGEPTLAVNIEEMIVGIRKMAPHIPQFILTNGTELHRPEVRKRLLSLDKITVKLDAGSEKVFQTINRPAQGITLQSIVEGAKLLRKEYPGTLEIQSMFVPLNAQDLNTYAEILKEINPDLIQLNTPTRPYPSEWHRENRGNHMKIFDYKVTSLKKLEPEEAKNLEKKLKELTGLKFQSIF